jgi:cytochrome c
MHKRKITVRIPENSRLAFALAILFGMFVSCSGGKTARAYSIVTGGAPGRGEQIILSKSCGSCHTIPGVRGARGLVGPPLEFFGRRTFIAGELPNTPDNLVRWIRSPQSVEAGTAMPNLGLSEQQARDVAAYLYTLR